MRCQGDWFVFTALFSCIFLRLLNAAKEMLVKWSNHRKTGSEQSIVRADFHIELEKRINSLFYFSSTVLKLELQLQLNSANQNVVWRRCFIVLSLAVVALLDVKRLISRELKCFFSATVISASVKAKQDSLTLPIHFYSFTCQYEFANFDLWSCVPLPPPGLTKTPWRGLKQYKNVNKENTTQRAMSSYRMSMAVFHICLGRSTKRKKNNDLFLFDANQMFICQESTFVYFLKYSNYRLFCTVFCVHCGDSFGQLYTKSF